MKLKNLLTMAIFSLIPTSTAAVNDTLDVSDFGHNVTAKEVVNNIIGTLQDSILYIAGAAFVVGALFYAMGGAKEDWKSTGKSIMIGSLVGLAIVVAAKAILNLTMYLIYGT